MSVTCGAGADSVSDFVLCYPDPVEPVKLL